MLSLLAARAHDNIPQPPIIALFDNKLYTVSADDGASTVLVEQGIVTRWYTAGFESTTFSTLYTLDNKTLQRDDINFAHYALLHDSTDAYYVYLKPYGELESLVNIVTGEEKMFDAGYYPAVHSHNSPDDSLHVFRVEGMPATYFVYGQTQQEFIGSIEEINGVAFSLSPDGQSLAYLQPEQGNRAPIRIMDMKDEIRELPFVAEQIAWGALDYVPFFAPG